MTNGEQDAHAQSDTIAALRALSAAASPTGAPEVIETHAAMVFLVGDTALKLKKAVDLGYLDFSTIAKRADACHAEIALNRPNAPQIYRDVAPIIRDAAGVIRVGEPGETSATVIDHVVRMARFDEADVFSNMARDGRLSDAHLVATARLVARMHADAPRHFEPAAVERLTRVADDITRALNRAGDGLDHTAVAAFHNAATDALVAHRSAMMARLENGWVRRCHGDLHLRNLVLINGVPVPFDALEFDDALGTVDVLYDLAFLLMDLVAAGNRRGANRVLNTYLSESGPPDHLANIALVPLFAALRAGIRAMVAENQFETQNNHPREALDTAAQYLAIANAFLEPEAPQIIAIGGWSGTGKSSVARHIAGDIGRRLGAVHLRSDVIRKQRAGVSPTTRLPPSHYTPEASQSVYRALMDRAAQTVRQGMPVVVDAVFGTAEERGDVASAAARAGVPLRAFWLRADLDVLKARVAGRTGDASDATVDVLERQAQTLPPPDDWISIAAGGSIDQTGDAIRAHLAEMAGGGDDDRQ